MTGLIWTVEADALVQRFQRDASREAGIFHHLITLPTYHTAALSTDNLAKEYGITREQAARRIDLANWTNSLLLTKSINAVPHTGGDRFKKDSEFHRTILAWLKAGAPASLDMEPYLARCNKLNFDIHAAKTLAP